VATDLKFFFAGSAFTQFFAGRADELSAATARRARSVAGKPCSSR